MARLYEVMFIVRPDVVDEEPDKLVAGFEATVTNGGGIIKNSERLGRRKLAYTGPQVQRRQLRPAHHRGQWRGRG